MSYKELIKLFKDNTTAEQRERDSKTIANTKEYNRLQQIKHRAKKRLLNNK